MSMSINVKKILFIIEFLLIKVFYELKSTNIKNVNRKKYSKKKW